MFHQYIFTRNTKSAAPFSTYVGTSEARKIKIRTCLCVVGKINLRDLSGSSSKLISAVSSKGNVSFKIRPLLSAKLNHDQNYPLHQNLDHRFLSHSSLLA
jgi:hypothetical protein